MQHKAKHKAAFRYIYFLYVNIHVSSESECSIHIITDAALLLNPVYLPSESI